MPELTGVLISLVIGLCSEDDTKTVEFGQQRGEYAPQAAGQSQ